MKIVLREHVEHLGDRGQVVTVAAGYARNYLIPKRLAFLATPGNMKVVEQQRRVWAAQEAREVEAARQLAAHLAEVELTVTKKAGESGTLYGSVTTGEIAELLRAKGIEIDRRRIAVRDAIKTLGEHEVTIKLRREIVGHVKLRVSGEED